MDNVLRCCYVSLKTRCAGPSCPSINVKPVGEGRGIIGLGLGLGLGGWVGCRSFEFLEKFWVKIPAMEIEIRVKFAYLGRFIFSSKVSTPPLNKLELGRGELHVLPIILCTKNMLIYLSKEIMTLKKQWTSKWPRVTNNYFHGKWKQTFR